MTEVAKRDPGSYGRFCILMDSIGWWVVRRLLSVVVFTYMILRFIDAQPSTTKTTAIWIGIAGLVYRVANISLCVSKYRAFGTKPEN